MISNSINGYKQKSNVELDIETMELKKLARVLRFQIPFQSRFYNFPIVHTSCNCRHVLATYGKNFAGCSSARKIFRDSFI